MSMGLQGMGSGMSRGLLPGTGWVRRGVELAPGQRLPKGLLGRVWRVFARPYLPRLLLLLLVIAAAAALTVVPAAIFKGMLDAVTRPGDGALRTLNLLALAAVAVAVANAGLSLWQRYLSSWVGERLIFDLRRALYDHVQRMPLAFFTRTQTGALVNRLNNDVVGAQRALTGTFGTLTANLVQVVAAVGYMFALDWRLTLLVLSVLPLFVVVAKSVGRRLQDLTRQSMAVNAEMNTVMTERFNVAGALLVKLFGDPRREAEQFSSSAQAVAGLGVRSAVVGRLFFVTLALMGAVGTAAVYWLGGRGVLSGDFSIGEVVAFALLVERAYAPLAALTNAPVEVLTALVSFDRVFEILDLPHPLADADGAVALEAPRGEVVFDRVSFAYPSAADASLASLERGWHQVLDAAPGAPVLRDVSFTALPGQTVALVGPSGAGKSSVCNLVVRLYDVSEGAVRIDGQDVREVTLASLAAAVGVVSQDPHLFHDTVATNLRYARPDATDAELEAACRAAQIHDVVTALPQGYDTVVGERGYRLSGGEKQRLALARVLLKDPAIVVLDEATSHLDSESEAAVQSALTSALAGRTSLVIAHRLSTIVHADQILVLQAGRVVQRGTHHELVRAEGLYAELYHTQFTRG
ncbi:MAG: ABC transporter ATP-binding protein/permease [Actinomycetota bacterium]|nr:ABC transporter ATP-binding protein/permease [Actinomycetota bacterium]